MIEFDELHDIFWTASRSFDDHSLQAMNIYALEHVYTHLQLRLTNSPNVRLKCANAFNIQRYFIAFQRVLVSVRLENAFGIKENK